MGYREPEHTRQDKDRYLVNIHNYLSVWDLNGPMSDAISALEEIQDEMIDPKINIGYVEEYGGGEIEIEITGDRLATDKEIKKFVAKKEKDKVAAAERKKKEKEQRKIDKEAEDAAALARAEKAFPDRFK